MIGNQAKYNKLSHKMKFLIWTLALTVLSGGFFTDRLAEASIPEGSITNLYDAFGRDSVLHKDFGFSCILKHAGKIILFDAGSNADIFKYNTGKLKINLKKIDAVIVSHGHFDHLNGIDYLLQVNPKVKIYMPYDIFWGAPVPFDATGPDSTANANLPKDMRYFDGGPTRFTIRQSGRFWGANIEFVKTGQEIFPGVTVVPTSSPYIGYFSGYPNKSFVEGQFQGDDHSQYKYTNLPELSLALRTGRGQVLVVGCSHSGVEHIVEAAKKTTGDRVDLVYGGFHLIPFEKSNIESVAKYLKNDLGVRRVAPAHCTGHLAFGILRALYGDQYLYAGLGETIRY